MPFLSNGSVTWKDHGGWRFSSTGSMLVQVTDGRIRRNGPGTGIPFIYRALVILLCTLRCWETCMFKFLNKSSCDRFSFNAMADRCGFFVSSQITSKSGASSLRVGNSSERKGHRVTRLPKRHSHDDMLLLAQLTIPPSPSSLNEDSLSTASGLLTSRRARRIPKVRTRGGPIAKNGFNAVQLEGRRSEMGVYAVG